MATQIKHAILDTIPLWEHPDAVRLVSRFDLESIPAPGVTGHNDHGGIVTSLLLLPFAGDAENHPTRIFGVLNGDGYMLGEDPFMWAMDQVERWIGPFEAGTLNFSWGRDDQEADVTNKDRWDALCRRFQTMQDRIDGFLERRPNCVVLHASGNSNGIPTSGGGLLYDSDADVDFPARLAKAVSATNQTPRQIIVGAHATGDHWPLRPYSGDGEMVTCIAGDGERALGPQGWVPFQGTSGACPEANAVVSHAMQCLEDTDLAVTWMIKNANHPTFLAAETLTSWQDENGHTIRHCWHHGCGTVHPDYMPLRDRGLIALDLDPSLPRPYAEDATGTGTAGGTVFLDRVGIRLPEDVP